MHANNGIFLINYGNKILANKKQHSFVQHVGLGAGVEKVDVEVRWPSGRVQKFVGLPVKSEVQRLKEL